MVRRFKLKPDERITWEVEPVQIPGPEPGAGVDDALFSFEALLGLRRDNSYG